jgi:hypothetical protein
MKDIHCCDLLKKYTSDGSVAVRYVSRFREYSIDIRTSDITCIRIDYCPWCGQKLPTSLRNECFDELEKLGYDGGIFDDNIPKKYQTDEWWRERGL